MFLLKIARDLNVKNIVFIFCKHDFFCYKDIETFISMFRVHKNTFEMHGFLFFKPLNSCSMSMKFVIVEILKYAQIEPKCGLNNIKTCSNLA